MYSSSDLRVVLLALNLMMILLINCLLFTGKEVFYFLGSLAPSVCAHIYLCYCVFRRSSILLVGEMGCMGFPIQRICQGASKKGEGNDLSDILGYGSLPRDGTKCNKLARILFPRVPTLIVSASHSFLMMAS